MNSTNNDHNVLNYDIKIVKSEEKVVKKQKETKTKNFIHLSVTRRLGENIQEIGSKVKIQQNIIQNPESRNVFHKIRDLLFRGKVEIEIGGQSSLVKIKDLRKELGLGRMDIFLKSKLDKGQLILDTTLANTKRSEALKEMKNENVKFNEIGGKIPSLQQNYKLDSKDMMHIEKEYELELKRAAYEKFESILKSNNKISDGSGVNTCKRLKIDKSFAPYIGSILKAGEEEYGFSEKKTLEVLGQINFDKGINSMYGIKRDKTETKSKSSNQSENEVSNNQVGETNVNKKVSNNKFDFNDMRIEKTIAEESAFLEMEIKIQEDKHKNFNNEEKNEAKNLCSEYGLSEEKFKDINPIINAGEEFGFNAQQSVDIYKKKMDL